ncbi:MAG TPA: hypothetical protein VLF20_00750 [Patescibacteria group bacterium]|nr:hypothetical protein [Patescibacteria group bacterium]
MAKDKDRDLIDKMNSALTEDIETILHKVLAVQLGSILAKLDVIENQIGSVEKEQKKQGKEIRYIKKTLDVAVRVFNEEDVRLRKRVERIEKHVGLPVFE